MSDERKMILEMLANGEISVDDAERLIDAVKASDEVYKAEATRRRAFPKRLILNASENGKQIVNMKLPYSLVSVGLRLGTKFGMDKYDINGNSIINGNDVTQLLSDLNFDEIELPYTLLDADNEGYKVLIVLE